MKKITIGLVLLMLIGGFSHLDAQPRTKGNFKAWWFSTMRNLRPTPWTVGAGWNIVDDNGSPFKHLFSAKTAWNIPPYPSALRVEKYLDKGWSGVFYFAYNRYKVGKDINSDIPQTVTSNFFSFDLNVKFNFFYLYDVNTMWFRFEKKVFDVYAICGLGYTYRHTDRFNGACTFNLGFGTNIHIYKNWGINLQAMSKFGLKAPLIKTPTNYLQYSFGAVYTFKLPPKKLGKRHWSKSKLLPQM